MANTYSRRGAEQAIQGRWFKLEEGQSAHVIFLGFVHDAPDGGVVYFPQHYSQANGYNDCTRREGEPEDVCKWCKEGEPVQMRMATTIYNVDAGRAQIWTASIAWLAGRDGVERSTWKHKPPASSVYIIERTGSGKKTRYPLTFDEKIPDDLQEKLMGMSLFTTEELIGHSREGGAGGTTHTTDDAPPPTDEDDLPF